MMKILMASNYFASHKGGVEIVARELFGGFTALGHEVAWAAGDATSPPEPIGKSRAVPLPVLNFVEAKMGLPFPIPTVNSIRKIVREVKKADVVVLHDCLYLSNMVAFLIAWARKKPVVIIQHIGSFPTSNLVVNMIVRLGTRIVTRPMLTNASQVVFISETTRKHFAHLRFRSIPKVIFNGVDAKLFCSRRESESIQTNRHELGLDEQGTTILFVGRFVEKKGIPVLKRMVEQRADWTWVFAGWGPLNPSQWNAPNVRVFSDLKGPSIAALYRACDLLVLPSVGEGFPLVIQEALACGLQVVCGGDTLQADPALANYAKGAPVYMGDEDRTASAFLAAIQDSLTSDELSAQSRRDFAVQHYSWNRSIQQYLEIISRLQSEAIGMKAGCR
jgi:glycosyltransferase involved in cell wall biosynthesis